MQVSKHSRLALAAVAVAAFGFSCPISHHGGVTDIGQTPYYAQTSWAGVHRDARNSDFAPFVAPAVNEVKWEVLDGAVTCCSRRVSDPRATAMSPPGAARASVICTPSTGTATCSGRARPRPAWPTSTPGR